MELKNIIDTKLCRIDFSAKTKKAALERIAIIASNSKFLETIKPALVLEKITEREEMGSTGFGDGIAIPHARISGLKEFIVFILISPKGVEFDTLDQRKAHIFCVILAPEEMVNEHLEILASFSRLLSISGIKRELRSARTSEILYETIAKYSYNRFKVDTTQKLKLMIIILYYEEFMYPVLEYLIENGVKGSTIIESEGMGSYISSIPLFASFLGFMRNDKNRSKTILALIPEVRENIIFEGIERITGDLDKKDGAMIMTFNISRHKGTMGIM
ncbi:MAG: PTS sugar transporter subunit IIA [Spirochaetes bacterium]|jgi:PTS system nitrogen regulatory IIA component|nr:PTS sugar transporter subunit IIA [Spirochaetota bacterium]